MSEVMQTYLYVQSKKCRRYFIAFAFVECKPNQDCVVLVVLWHVLPYLFL